MSHYRHALIVGASSGVGRALSLELAKLGCSVSLAARDQIDLEALAAHIKLSFNVPAKPVILDLEKNLDLDFSQFDAVFVTAGVSIAEDAKTISHQEVPELIKRLVGINMLGPSQILLQSFVNFRDRSTQTYLGVCSTIATPVPRAKNLIYAAAKNGLESLVKSLQHAATGSNVTVQLFRLGYVDSGLSYGQKLLFPILSPEVVAKKIISSTMTPNKRMIYIPFYWQYILLVLKNLPWTVFTKLRF